MSTVKEGVLLSSEKDVVIGTSTKKRGDTYNLVARVRYKGLYSINVEDIGKFLSRFNFSSGEIGIFKRDGIVPGYCNVCQIWTVKQGEWKEFLKELEKMPRQKMDRVQLKNWRKENLRQLFIRRISK